jgi:hypothetical protein
MRVSSYSGRNSTGADRLFRQGQQPPVPHNETAGEHFTQENLEFVNNTCLNIQDLKANTAEGAGLWADGSASQHIENLVGAMIECW